jgi:hypothetical protein
VISKCKIVAFPHLISVTIKVNDNENTAAYALQSGMDGIDITY